MPVVWMQVFVCKCVTGIFFEKQIVGALRQLLLFAVVVNTLHETI